MTYFQAFRHVAMRAMLALVSWSFLLCAALAGLGYLSGSIGPLEIDNLLVLFGVSLIAGYVVLMVFTVPIYTWCLRSGRAWWTSVVCIGAVPGATFLMVWVSLLGLLVLASGLVVTIATHLMVVKDFAAGSNASFQRGHAG
jgi:hypothetical protein